MSTMIKKSVSELEGEQLDWAVEKAETGAKLIAYDGNYVTMPLACVPPYSRNWAHGGPIIERERISTVCYEDMYVAYAGADWSSGLTVELYNYSAYDAASTPLIAAMRAFVASKLGDEVEVPV